MELIQVSSKYMHRYLQYVFNRGVGGGQNPSKSVFGKLVVALRDLLVNFESNVSDKKMGNLQECYTTNSNDKTYMSTYAFESRSDPTIL